MIGLIFSFFVGFIADMLSGHTDKMIKELREDRKEYFKKMREKHVKS